ncbi:hypothetical protein FB451DRAFT_421834 [Mycena latifolia]|nr:hypothetical protein FB451DRAFT_421834 [Mycena latifolia]
MRGGGACYGRRRVYRRLAWGGVGYPSNPIPDCSPQTPAALGAHAHLLSWFLDAPAAPFGVHRMALAGKAAGKNVGMWFGPSATASAVRMLVDAFPRTAVAFPLPSTAASIQLKSSRLSFANLSLYVVHLGTQMNDT